MSGLIYEIFRDYFTPANNWTVQHNMRALRDRMIRDPIPTINYPEIVEYTIREYSRLARELYNEPRAQSNFLARNFLFELDSNIEHDNVLIMSEPTSPELSETDDDEPVLPLRAAFRDRNVVSDDDQ